MVSSCRIENTRLNLETTLRAIDATSHALGGIGKRAVRSLKKLLKADSAWVRAASARGLGRIGKDAKSAASSLKRLLKDRDQNVRREAQAALRRVKP